MELSFTNRLPFKIAGSVFKNSTSAFLTGITVAGAFSTLIFNSEKATLKINESFSSILKVLNDSYFYDGFKEVFNTLKDWGRSVVTSKDDFKDWIYRYLGPDGFKSGLLSLYEKLFDWVTIVYEWFRDKFIEFIRNIPDMVENWKKLRFTLFKWGTFLGGGGGSALWAMFGSFENLGKFAELMGNEKVREAAEMFAELLDKNPDSFANMEKEVMEEIFEKIAEEPDVAKEIINELQEEQKDMTEKEKATEENPPQLEQERIEEAFRSKGSPSNEIQVFGNLVNKLLSGLSSLKTSYSGEFNSLTVEAKAKEEIEKYMKEIQEKKGGNTKLGKVYEAFLKTLESDLELFKQEMEKLAKKAFWKSNMNSIGDSRQLDSLKDNFAQVMENDLTQLIPEGEDVSEAVDLRKIIQGKERK